MHPLISICHVVWVRALSQPQDAPNTQVQTSGTHTARDDTLSVTLHVSPTAITCLSLRYIYSLFGLTKAGHTVQ